MKVAFDEPRNINARGGMLIGSCLAGVAFTKGLGLVHSISHMVGAEYNTQHGLTNAIILPAVMKFNLPHVGEKLSSISHAMELKDASPDFINEEIEKFVNHWKIPAKKFGSSDDLGSFVAMFCSEQASYVIGQSLVIDGGIGNTTF